MINDENLKLIDMAVRNIKASGRELNYDRQSCSYKPVYRIGDIVECEFVGIDKEFNYRHFAIIWNVKANNENVNIIPLTSKIKDESIGEFNLGKINGFYTKLPNNGGFVNKDSFVYVNKLTEVSRKRIYPKYEQNNTGEFVKVNGRVKQLNIGAENIELIKNSIKMFYLDEGKSLCNLINDKINFKYQLDITSVDIELLDNGHKLIESYAIHKINEDIILICFINKKRYSLRFKPIGLLQTNNHKIGKYKNLYDRDIRWNNNVLNIRKEIVQALFSKNNKKVNQAKDILNKFWT